MGIITLLVINSTISFIEENNAGNAAAALMASLAPKAKVYKIFFSINAVKRINLYASVLSIFIWSISENIGAKRWPLG